MGRYIRVARINRGPCVLKHKYHRHWNHGRPRVGFWGIFGVPSSEPFFSGGGVWLEGSIDPPPPRNENPASPVVARFGVQARMVAPKWRGVTGRGEGVFCPAGGRTSGAWLPPKGVESRARGTGCPAQPVVARFRASAEGAYRGIVSATHSRPCQGVVPDIVHASGCQPVC